MTRLTRDQRRVIAAAYAKGRFDLPSDLERLAALTGLSIEAVDAEIDAQVRAWEQGRRKRDRAQRDLANRRFGELMAGQSFA